MCMETGCVYRFLIFISVSLTGQLQLGCIINLDLIITSNSTLVMILQADKFYLYAFLFMYYVIVRCIDLSST